MDDIGELGKAAPFAPAILGTWPEREHHVEHAVPAEAALGSLGAVAGRGESALPLLSGWRMMAFAEIADLTSGRSASIGPGIRRGSSGVFKDGIKQLQNAA